MFERIKNKFILLNFWKTMKNQMLCKLAVIIFLVILGGLFTYFFVTLNRVDKKLNEIQTVVLQNSEKVGGIVNFFNANLNAQNNN